MRVALSRWLDAWLRRGIAFTYTFKPPRRDRMTAKELDELCMELVTDPDLKQRDYDGDGDLDTFCNRAVMRACRRYGERRLDGKRANQMVSLLTVGLSGWARASAEQAIAHAAAGGLAIAGKHYPSVGHVAVVAPRPGQFSPSWGKVVPVLANVGTARAHGLRRASEAFPVSLGEPDYWTFTPPQEGGSA